MGGNAEHRDGPPPQTDVKVSRVFNGRKPE